MRKGTTADQPVILNILTEAFDDNESVNYVVNQDHRRVERIRKLMDYSFKMCHTFGEVWMSDDQQACTLILFPDKKRFSFRSLLWDVQLALNVIGISRVSAVLKREAMIKANHPKEPIAYLWFIGVDSQHQGRGVGSAFMQELIRECEKKKRPIYLETSTEKNLPFYEKLGFEMFQSLELTYKLYQLRRG